MARYGFYPWSVAAYIELAAAAPWRLFSAMDLCVEPEIACDDAAVLRVVDTLGQVEPSLVRIDAVSLPYKLRPRHPELHAGHPAPRADRSTTQFRPLGLRQRISSGPALRRS